jgi:hypothetical protein
MTPEQRLKDIERTDPPPTVDVPAHPDNVNLWTLADFMKRRTIWNMERIIGNKLLAGEAKDRDIESRALDSLERTLERLVKLEKQIDTNNAEAKKTYDELTRELIAGVRKVVDQRGEV